MKVKKMGSLPTVNHGLGMLQDKGKIWIRRDHVAKKNEDIYASNMKHITLWPLCWEFGSLC